MGFKKAVGVVFETQIIFVEGEGRGGGTGFPLKNNVFPGRGTGTW